MFRVRVEPCVCVAGTNLLPFEHPQKECPLADSVFLFLLCCCFVVVAVLVVVFPMA